MEKIESLSWTNEISITSFGLSIRIRTNSAASLERSIKCLPPLWKLSSSRAAKHLYSLYQVSNQLAEPSVNQFNLLYKDNFEIARTTNEKELFQAFEADLRMLVAENAPRKVFVHAGAVVWKERGIIVPGRSFSGKTTLVAALVKAGATYYSDEYAVLDQQGQVHPFPKPLSLRDNGSTLQTDYSVESLGGRQGAEPLPVNLIIVSEYKSGAKWKPKQLTSGQAALELLNNTVSARRAPEAALTFLSQTVLRAHALKGVRGEAAQIAEMILETVENNVNRTFAF